jgi:hypothetical protein
MGHVPRCFLIAILTAAVHGPVSAQPSGPPAAEVEQALASIRPQAIRAHMRFLADDLLEGRGTASRGYELAARYVETALEGMGLAPAGVGGGFSQPVPLRRTTTVESECSMALIRDGRRLELKPGEDYLADADGILERDSSVTAPVVFVGYGVTAPESGYDDYAGVDVRGKLVALLMGTPATLAPHQRAYYAESLTKVGNAASRGAVGILVITPPERERLVPWEFLVQAVRSPALGWLDDEGRERFHFPEMRGFAFLSRKGAEELFKGAPRSLAEVFEAVAASRPQSFELPVQVSLRVVGRQEKAASTNVAAVLRGSDSRLREEYVLLTAHLDHLGTSEPVDGDSIYNGAYDNASGVAILLEVARALSRLPVAPRRSVLFLAVTGEEEGLQGSDFFAQHPTVPVDRIVANVNLDMVMMLQPLRDVIAFGAEHSTLGRVVEEAARRLGVAVSPDPIPEEVRFVRSDHYSFVRQGIPAIFLTSGFQTGESADGGKALFEKWEQERYHRPGDDLSQAFDFEAGAQFARINFLIAWLVAQEEKAPSWNPGDFFAEKFWRRPATIRQAGTQTP